jgi:hypothetical protein
MFQILLISLALMGLGCGCSNLQSGPAQGQPVGETAKIQTRNNAASLLSDLLKDESNVGKVFIVKSADKDITALVKLIGATAATHERELEEMATNDPELDLHVAALPPGESAARTATAKAKEHDLLFSTGVNFEFNLLYSQAEAQSYGWHLAVVAAENSPKPEQQRVFSAISQAMNHSYEQVVQRMRALPAN